MDVDALKNEFHLVCLVRSLRETHRLTGSRWVSAKADSSQGFVLEARKATTVREVVGKASSKGDERVVFIETCLRFGRVD
jgi:hypothetical protein